MANNRPKRPVRPGDPLADQREAARRERVERLLGTVPKLTTGKAMRFTKTAQRAAERKARGGSVFSEVASR